ncbi:hypothetical protein PDJAM_G00258210 [Pangasius djambal]|uniref:Uncharacterized protein n=1 Tax=Pangasius djambal TaxID=1691987 RepID=A0ACC5YL05_9TELE|nr:hypothetical protein [Pangasius djambal]
MFIGYAPHVGCELEEKERFWSELDEVIESIPTGWRVVIGADFNGHVGEGNTGDEEVMGKFGVKERNLEGQMVVDFAKRMDMAVVNTYFQKREEHRDEFVRNVLEVKRVSDRVMSLKLEIEGVMLNVVSGYAPHVGCELEEKERLWSELDEVIESIPTGERVVIGADFNGHVGDGNTGDEEMMGKFGVKERNLEGQMVVDFAKRMDMAVVNTYFQKREEHRVTYKSGGRSTQVDYILCRRGNLKEISDCKLVVGESVARQHRMMMCRMSLMVCKRKRSKTEIEQKTKWWKLKKEECCEDFRQKLRQALGGQVKRVSDRVMSLKLEIEEVMLNVVSGYAPQVGCELEEK